MHASFRFYVLLSDLLQADEASLRPRVYVSDIIWQIESHVNHNAKSVSARNISEEQDLLKKVLACRRSRHYCAWRLGHLQCWYSRWRGRAVHLPDANSDTLKSDSLRSSRNEGWKQMQIQWRSTRELCYDSRKEYRVPKQQTTICMLKVIEGSVGSV